MLCLARRYAVVLAKLRARNSRHILTNLRHGLVGVRASPWYHSRLPALCSRDVENLDRQDDNGATQLFSADTLEYIADHRQTLQYKSLPLYLSFTRLGQNETDSHLRKG